MSSARPAKRSRAKRSAAAPAGPPLEALVAACPRAGLEEICLAALRGEAPTRADLAAAVERNRPPPKPVVEVGDERSGTGAFDVVDGECFGAVLLHLSMPERLQLATVVCKSWLRLRSARGLWTSVAANNVPPVLSTLCQAACGAGGNNDEEWEPVAHVLRERRSAPNKLNLRSQALQKLTEWILDKDQVVELSLDTSEEKISSEASVAAVAAFPRLHTLVLDGKKILTHFFKTCVKQHTGALARLRTLVVGMNVPSGGKGQFCKFLQECTSLETLCVPAELVPYNGLEAVAAAWRQKRGNAAPILTHLRIYGYGIYSQTSFGVAVECGRWFGNLETFAFSPKAYGSLDWSSLPAWSTFANLKHLRLGDLASWSHHATDDDLSEVLRVTLRCAPKLERLSVYHGEAHRTQEPLPDLPAGLRLPASITQLDLTEIYVRPGCIVEHSLKKLRVRIPNDTGIILTPDSDESDSDEYLGRCDKMVARLRNDPHLAGVTVERYFRPKDKIKKASAKPSGDAMSDSDDDDSDSD